MGGPMTLPARLDRDYPRNHHILSGSSHLLYHLNSIYVSSHTLEAQK
jgi:hypothetical protein